MKLTSIAEQHVNKPNSMAYIILNQINSGFYSNYLNSINDGIVLDCGANIGLFSLYAAMSAKKVISVEPTKSHIQVMKSLIEANDIKNIFVEEAALAREDSKISFFENPNNSTMNSLLQYGEGSKFSYEVDGFTLSSLLTRNNLESVDFAKIDIEGSESLLFESEEFFETLKKIKTLFFEIHEVNNENFSTIQNKWINKLKNIYSNVEKVGIDGIYAY